MGERERESGKTCGLQKFRMARVGVPIFTISFFGIRNKGLRFSHSHSV